MKPVSVGALVLAAVFVQQPGIAQDKSGAKAASTTVDRKDFEALRREVIALRAEIMTLKQDAADAAKENLKRWAIS